MSAKHDPSAACSRLRHAAARTACLALAAVLLAACASGDRTLTRRGQADLQRVVPLSGMP